MQRACAWPGPTPVRRGLGRPPSRRALARTVGLGEADAGGADRRGRGGPDHRRRDGETDGATRPEIVRVVGRVRLVVTARAAIGSRPTVAGFGRTACRALARPAGRAVAGYRPPVRVLRPGDGG